MKRCFKCGIEKPLADFYRHPMMADGRLNKCKDCARRDVRSNRAAKIGQYRAYDKARAVLPQRRAVRDAYAKTPAGKAAHARSLKSDRERSPEKQHARNLLRRAILSGKVTRLACEVCGKPNTHGHHTDYSKPLDVQWLCPLHHAQAHGRALAAPERRPQP